MFSARRIALLRNAPRHDAPPHDDFIFYPQASDLITALALAMFIFAAMLVLFE